MLCHRLSLIIYLLCVWICKIAQAAEQPSCLSSSCDAAGAPSSPTPRTCLTATRHIPYRSYTLYRDRYEVTSWHRRLPLRRAAWRLGPGVFKLLCSIYLQRSRARVAAFLLILLHLPIDLDLPGKKDYEPFALSLHSSG